MFLMDFTHWQEKKAKCLEPFWLWPNVENTVHKCIELVISGNGQSGKRKCFVWVFEIPVFCSIYHWGRHLVLLPSRGNHSYILLAVYRNKLSDLVPYWMYKPGWQTILGRSTKATVEQNLIAHYKDLSETLNMNCESLCNNGKLFLEKCWDLPYYG